jgi:hypothetical protein
MAGLGQLHLAARRRRQRDVDDLPIQLSSVAPSKGAAMMIAPQKAALP